jgi:hypothetical protein
MQNQLTCRVCSKQFNVKEIIRVYGEMLVNYRCCSPQCYTNFLNSQKTPAELKAQLISRVYRLTRFKTLEQTPEEILTREQEFVDQSFQLLKSAGIDAQTYLESDEGKSDYLMHSVEHESRDAAMDRCGNCEYHEMIDIEIGKTIYRCAQKVELFPDFCRAYQEDEQWETRLLEYAIERCENCKNVVILKEVGFDMPYCPKKLNRLKKECLDYDPKEF